MLHENTLPKLTESEVRVLGSLLEKSKTTPDYYPMTVNSVMLACNQKSSRHPVVDYSEETVIAALKGLKARNLVSQAIGGGSRTIKYKHNFGTIYPLSDGEIAILCLLFLRGPLTPGEINSNSARLHEFVSLEVVLEALSKLTEAVPPFIKELPKRAGQKEMRYVHLFTEHTEQEQPAEKSVAVKEASPSYEERLSNMEKEIAELKEAMAKINKELYG